jgi:hypothetical protein
MFDRLSKIQENRIRIVAIDVDGYRTGALNELLTRKSPYLPNENPCRRFRAAASAIADALVQSSKVSKIYAAPGNRGIRDIAELVPLQADDLEGLVRFAKTNSVDLTLSVRKFL